MTVNCEEKERNRIYGLDQIKNNSQAFMTITHVSRNLLGGLVVLAKPVETSVGNSDSRFLGIW
jgi:hypothetical protein